MQVLQNQLFLREAMQSLLITGISVQGMRLVILIAAICHSNSLVISSGAYIK
jgi:hypothetical protein